MSIRVLLADDQAFVRSGFRVLLTQDPAIDVVGEAGDGAMAVELAGTLRPDVVLMDIRMPVMDGIEATRRIADNPATTACRVVVLTTYELDEYIFAALRAGASGFLLKDGEPEELRAAVHTVAAMHCWRRAFGRRRPDRHGDWPAIDNRLPGRLDRRQPAHDRPSARVIQKALPRSSTRPTTGCGGW